MQAGEPPSLLLQIAITLVALVLVYGVMTLVDMSINSYSSASKVTATLIPDTTGDTIIIPQSIQSGAPLLYPSSNQPTGQEFSFSCFLNIAEDTFATSSAARCGTSSTSSGMPSSTVLKHIFSKGTANSFPLMAPGVFCRADKNTLRIYMNTNTQWNNFVEVDNIPIKKWFHLVIILTGTYLDVYINGNAVNRIKFAGAVAKINFGPVFVLNNRHFPDSSSTSQPDFIVDGAAKAMISRLEYFAYALNGSQIHGLFQQGPSSTVTGTTTSQLVPYQADNWPLGQSA